MANPSTRASELFALHRWTAEDVRAIFKLWEVSELSLSSFAEQHGIDPQRLYWWQRKLRFPRQQRAAAAAPVPGLHFEEVKVDRMAEAGTALEVVLRSGLVVRVGNSFDATTLQRLIATLEGRAA